MEFSTQKKNSNKHQPEAGAKKAKPSPGDGAGSEAGVLLFLQGSLQTLAAGDGIQLKSAFDAPSDPHEQEADQIAARVSSADDSSVHHTTIGSRPGLRTNETNLPPSDRNRLQTMEAGGQALPLATRAYYETRFNQDFGRVRVHDDA